MNTRSVEFSTERLPERAIGMPIGCPRGNRLRTGPPGETLLDRNDAKVRKRKSISDQNTVCTLLEEAYDADDEGETERECRKL